MGAYSSGRHEDGIATPSNKMELARPQAHRKHSGVSCLYYSFFLPSVPLIFSLPFLFPSLSPDSPHWVVLRPPQTQMRMVRCVCFPWPDGCAP